MDDRITKLLNDIYVYKFKPETSLGEFMKSLDELSDSDWDNFIDEADAQLFAFLSYCKKWLDKASNDGNRDNKLKATRARNYVLQNYVSSYQKFGRHTQRSVHRLLHLTNIMLSQALELRLITEPTMKTVEHIQQCCENLYENKEYATEQNKGEIVSIRIQVAQFRLAYLAIDEHNMVECMDPLFECLEWLQYDKLFIDLEKSREEKPESLDKLLQFITEIYTLLIKISGSTAKYLKRPVSEKYLVPGISSHSRQFFKQLGDDEAASHMKEKIKEETANQEAKNSVETDYSDR